MNQLNQAKFPLAFFFIAMVVGLPYWLASSKEAKAYHSDGDIHRFTQIVDSLPLSFNDYFAASGRCQGCHGHDIDGLANIASEYGDVNVVDDWRATMMANSAKDPFWRAKVVHETTAAPALKAEIETKCTSCHAPMGHYTAMYGGAQNYSMFQLQFDSLGMDGVSCNACHQLLNPDDVPGPLKFSGELDFDTTRKLYGPYDSVFADPMTNFFVEYEPLKGEHITQSELCAGCHTLITETIDLAGNLTGNEFVEQATYHEWLNSDYAVTGTECQGCHFPRINQDVVISNNYAFLDPQPFFGLHYMVGGNSFMTKLMRDNKAALGLTATVDQFNRVVERTELQLKQESLDMLINYNGRDADSVYFDLTLTNKAGHKLPSGYPARRVTIEFVVLTDSGDTLWSSGVHDGNYEVFGQNSTYEPHYDIINDENEVQIYELVLGDVNGDVTTVLERADIPLKDNRLTPVGFNTAHVVYDTTVIAGNALTDDDFNKDAAGVEGTGTDNIRYHIPTNGNIGELNAIANIYYQAAPPKWMEEMFAVDQATINAFEDMYNNADKAPVLMQSENEIAPIFVNIEEASLHENVKIYPNPFIDDLNVVLKDYLNVHSIEVIDSEGKLVYASSIDTNEDEFSINLSSLSAGFYFLRINIADESIMKRIVKQ